MSDQPTAFVPNPSDFQMTAAQHRYFLAAQAIASQAVEQLGLQMGASVALSGLTRELRRHVSIEDLQHLLRGLADTLPEVAKFDTPD